MRLKAGVIMIFTSVTLFVSWIAIRPDPWQKYGVSHSHEVGPTGTYYTYRFTREYEGSRIPGPRIQGSTLKLKYRDIDDDGIAEAILQSSTFDSYRTVIRIHPTPESGRHFTIVSSEGLGVNWPIDNYNKD
jgi:hypothetical protein